MDGRWLNLYLYANQQLVIIRIEILHGNVGSIISPKTISFEKFHTPNYITSSARGTDE